jgi:hypothetical protein
MDSFYVGYLKSSVPDMTMPGYIVAKSLFVCFVGYDRYL